MEASSTPTPVAPAVPTPAADATTTPAASAETPAAAPANKARPYAIYTEHTLDVSSAAARKEAIEALATLAQEGQPLVVLARTGRTQGKTPDAALRYFAKEVAPLDGDYILIPDSARNDFPNVKTKQETSVSFG